MRHFIFILLLWVLMFSSCTIEKMRYSSGYHVEWVSNKKHVRNIPKKPKRVMVSPIVRNIENTEIIGSDCLTVKEVLTEDSFRKTVQVKVENTRVFHQNFKRKTTDYREPFLTEKQQRHSEKNTQEKFRKTELHPIAEGLFYFFVVGPAISVLGVFALLFAQLPIAIFLFIAGGLVSIYGLVIILSFLINELFG